MIIPLYCIFHSNIKIIIILLLLPISGLSKQGSCVSLGKVYIKTAFTNLSFAKRFNNHHEMTILS